MGNVVAEGEWAGLRRCKQFTLLVGVTCLVFMYNLCPDVIAGQQHVGIGLVMCSFVWYMVS